MNTYKIDNQNPRLTNPNQFPYSINNIKKTLTISPGQKYDMAVKHLNEGLNASKSIYSDNNFPLYNNTLSNLPVNMGSKSNIKKRPILNSQKSQRNKKTTPMNQRAKNLNKEITKDMVDIRINAKEGFDAAYMNNNFIILNTNLTEDLIDEGVVRELISKVQQLRKTKNFEITDRINLYYDSTELKKVVDKFLDMLKSETLSVEVSEKSLSTEELDLNGIKAKIDVEKR